MTKTLGLVAAGLVVAVLAMCTFDDFLGLILAWLALGSDALVLVASRETSYRK